ncbi:hypothetical protein CP8484711_1323A, partial [Chlamydia psittaci 84-8471/1]
MLTSSPKSWIDAEKLILGQCPKTMCFQ